MTQRISVRTFKLLAFITLGLLLVPCAAMAYTEHSGTIATETWVAGTHYVSGNLTVPDNQTLTINPGAVVKFAPGVQMTIYGTLRAAGIDWEPDNSIVFTSRDDDTHGETIAGSDSTPERGDWDGIYLYGSGAFEGIGEFDYCLIRYGGNTAGLADANVGFILSDSGHFTNSISEYSSSDGVWISNCSPQIVDSVFKNNARHGLYASGGGAPTITVNTFTDNGQYAAYVNQSAIPPDIWGNSGSGNALDALVFSGTVAINQTWSTPGTGGFQIVLLSNITVSYNVTLTIAPGTVVKFGPGIQLTVLGTLDANGTAEERVVFTSLKDDDYGGDTNGDGVATTPALGDWNGIYLYGSGAFDGIGEFDYCLIRYGGNAAGSADANVGFILSDSGHFTNSVSEYSSTDGISIHSCSPQIVDSLFKNNTDHGLYASGGGVPTITGNIFTDNGQYAAYVNQNAIPPDIWGNSGSGNSLNGMVFSGTVAINQTWSTPGTGGFQIVLLSNITVSDNVTLTIAPGTVVKFGPGIQLTVLGTLDANGTAEERVVFTSLKDDDYGGDTNGDGVATTPALGDWNGIYLYGSGAFDGIGEFDYCLIRYGGNAAGSADANVGFILSDSGHFTNSVSEYSSTDGISINSCSPQIVDSLFKNNTGHGLYASGGGVPTITGNIFTDNGQYAAYFNQTAITLDISENSGSGNSLNGMVFSGTVAVDQTWSMTGTQELPIVLISNITVSDNVTLSIAPGTVVKFDLGIQLTVYGTLDANGSAEERVVFTSLKDDDYGGDTNGDADATAPAPGDWNGIYLYGSGAFDGIGEFDYCLIRYGGNAAGSADANVGFILSDSGHFTNSVSEYSSTDGISINSCSPTISNTTVSNNAAHGLTVSSGDPLITNCIFWGDGLDEISGTPEITYSDVQGGYEGEGNIDEDPMFMDPENSDYHIDVCSAVIDAGDPVEILTADYIVGETLLLVDRVTGVMAGDIIGITDGVNTESDEVAGLTESTISVSTGFANPYSVADYAYLYTSRSDYFGEPAPNGRRINMGAYGGGSQATASTACKADFDGDLDVDGMDLYALAAALGSSVGDINYDPLADLYDDGTVDINDMALFAEQFGRTDCPECP